MNTRLRQAENWQSLAEVANYSAAALARNCGVSLRQLQRFILQTQGKTAQRWLNELRLRKALTLIQTGNSVKQVAYELNYKQRSHFSREFKRFYGVPPSARQTETQEMSL
jgi:AraC-like DNA-binding protein